MATGKPKTKRGAPKQATADLYQEVFAAIAHPARRLILMTLNFEGGSMTAGDIAALFQHAWPTTTRHLRVLQDAGLIGQERHGRTRTYRIEKHRLGVARDWTAWFFKRPY